MEQRITAVEVRLKEFEYEFKAINRTLDEISKTLTEIKVLNSNVVEVRQDMVLMKRNLELLDAQTKKLFEYNDNVQVDISRMKLENSSNVAKNDVKIGYGERIIWAAITAIIAAWGLVSGDK